MTSISMMPRLLLEERELVFGYPPTLLLLWCRERLTDDIALDRYRTLNEKGKEEK